MNPSYHSDHACRAFVARGCRAVAVVALVLIAVGVIVGSPSLADAANCSAPLGAGEIRVVLVVDATDIGGASSATCLVVPAGTTGSQLLARRGAELGTGSPRYGSSGLLCAIDGLPGSGCGDRNTSGFAYWAYFNGSSGSWVYGNYNPFARRLADGDIEGWRYVSGVGNGQDPPPRIGPSRSLFPAFEPVAPELPELPSLPAPSIPPARVESPEPIAELVEVVPSTSTTVTTIPAEVDDVALASSTKENSTTGRWIGVVVVGLLIALMAVGAWRQTRRSR